MARRNFYEIINDSKINIRAEYDRIFQLFHSDEYGYYSLYDLVSESFVDFSPKFRGRTISLDDFDNTHNFHFGVYSQDITLEDLISYCEYVTNLCNQLETWYEYDLEDDSEENLKLLRIAIQGCMDDLGMVSTVIDGITIYIEKNAGAMSVAEIVPQELSFSVLEYNHIRLKGDLVGKQRILKFMADNIESERSNLRSINTGLESMLFQLMNKFVRHDHSRTPYIANMKDTEIESVYDDIYQMWLLAKLELDNCERKTRMKDLLDEING